VRPACIARGLLAALTIALPSERLAAQAWFDSHRTFSLYDENDALSRSGDESYTQGLRLTWDFLKWTEFARHAERWLSLHGFMDRLPLAGVKRVFDPCSPDRTRGRPPTPCGSVSFGLGQTIYTPADITTPALQRTDRPYAGWLFGTVAFNVRDGRWQSSSEGIFGILGPQSHAQSTQSLAHWTWSQASAQPQGWQHQLRNSFHIGLINSYGYHFIERCHAGGGCSGTYAEKRWFDFTPRAEFVAATFMRRASLGGTVRVGWRFPDAIIGQRIPATGRPSEGAPGRNRQWWWALFAGADQRAVGYNAFLQGSYADRGPNDWRAMRSITLEGSINEWAIGASAGNRAGSLTAQWISRSPEFASVAIAGQPARPQERHAFGAVTFSINVGR
jgi:hypothetical protein